MKELGDASAVILWMAIRRSRTDASSQVGQHDM